LALTTAGAYLRKSTLSFEQYLHEYEKRWDINPRRPLELHEYRGRTLYNTWDLSYARLKNDDPDAARLLELLAYFDNQHIWHDLLRTGINDHSPEWLLNVVVDLVDFENAMGTLVDYCFVEVHSSTLTYSMHACVHDWTFGGLNKVIDTQSYWYAVDCIVNSINEEDWDFLGHLRYARLAPHAARLAHDRFLQGDLFENALHNWIYKIEYIAQLLSKQVQLVAAGVLLERALAGKEKALGRDHASILNTVNNLGLLYRDQGNLDEAEQMYIRALAGKEKALGRDHTSTLNTVNNLGLLYRAQGKLDEAEQMVIRALAGYEKALGPDHTSTLDTVNNLGIL
jgi:tetratricopeptide (TPR) repeat protein